MSDTLLDPYKRIKRLIINHGRAFVKMFWDPTQTPQLLVGTGVPFDYNFTIEGGEVNSFGIIPPGGATIAVTTFELPPLEEGREVDFVALDLFLYPDPTPGVLEAALAASGGIAPPGIGGYPQSFSYVIFADNQSPENSYSGPIWSFNAQGMTGQLDDGGFQTFDPPVPPIIF